MDLILGIETSCDETSCAVVEGGRKVLSNVISSQVDLHACYGGVVPEIASRLHVERIIPVLDQALTQAGVSLKQLDAVGVTRGPGLVGALLVGISAAKGLSLAQGIPMLGVHHIEGHICANYLSDPEWEPPFICLVVSGGHSHIVHVLDHGVYQLLGRTRDDAAGEAFDKVARALSLGYPGGPALEKAALSGNPEAYAMPRPGFSDGSLDFSFSGIKTAVLNILSRAAQMHADVDRAGLAASFQKAVVDVLVENTRKAAVLTGCSRIALAGGVSANRALRSALEDAAVKIKASFCFPAPELCTDNAAMIASAAGFRLQKGETSGLDLNADPSWPLIRSVDNNG